MFLFLLQRQFGKIRISFLDTLPSTDQFKCCLIAVEPFDEARHKIGLLLRLWTLSGAVVGPIVVDPIVVVPTVVGGIVVGGC